MRMTKKLSLIAILFISLFSACKDDGPAPYTCTDCADQPEANAAYDNTGQGIYKGVVVGSTGTIKIDVANNGSSITAVLIIDGISVSLTGNGSYSTSSGFNSSLSGSLDGGFVVIPFGVSTTGDVTIGTPTIPGHSGVAIKVLKEKSTHLVEVFEGEFGGGDSGTFNLVMVRNSNGEGEWVAIAKSDSNTFFTGEIGNNQLVGGNSDFVIVGKVAGDNVSGDWEYVVNGTTATSGKWVGKRTL